MKRPIIITILLLIVTILVTVVYFKNLNTPAQHTKEILLNIPPDASMIFEMNNDQSFYDIFADNKLFLNSLGQEKMDDLEDLHKELLNDPLLLPFLNDQNVFISVHAVKTNGPECLFTLSVSKKFKTEYFDQFINHSKGKMIIQTIQINGKTGYNIFIKSIKKRFYLANKGNDIFCGSFSKELAEKAAAYHGKKNDLHFVLLPERQNINSLANLYINYSQLSSLFQQFFISKNTDIFKSFRMLPASATLTLNYKSDALMFSGTTTILTGQPVSYLNLFALQQPIVNHLKDLLPSTTAYSTVFALSDPAKFTADLNNYHVKAGLENEKKTLFNKVNSETGINLKSEFNKLLANEFGIVTTRYQEKIAIIQIKNGTQLRPLMVNISNMLNDDVGQFKFEKLPFFLLGDAFSILKKPYFRIIDNYLVMANSAAEINSYFDTYHYRKFLNNTKEYNGFDQLLAERSNVSFFINFKNAQQVLKEELSTQAYEHMENNDAGWKNFYGASCQFSSASKNYFTNLCIQLNQPDSTSLKNN